MHQIHALPHGPCILEEGNTAKQSLTIRNLLRKEPDEWSKGDEESGCGLVAVLWVGGWGGGGWGSGWYHDGLH